MKNLPSILGYVKVSKHSICDQTPQYNSETTRMVSATENMKIFVKTQDKLKTLLQYKNNLCILATMKQFSINQTATILFLEPENIKILNNGKWSCLITIFRGPETPSVECTAHNQPN